MLSVLPSAVRSTRSARRFGLDVSDGCCDAFVTIAMVFQVTKLMMNHS